MLSYVNIVLLLSIIAINFNQTNSIRNFAEELRRFSTSARYSTSVVNRGRLNESPVIKPFRGRSVESSEDVGVPPSESTINSDRGRIIPDGSFNRGNNRGNNRDYDYPSNQGDDDDRNYEVIDNSNVRNSVNELLY